MSQLNSKERAQFSVAKGRAQSKQKIGHLIVPEVTQSALQRINPVRGSSLSRYAMVPGGRALLPRFLQFTFLSA